MGRGVSPLDPIGGFPRWIGSPNAPGEIWAASATAAMALHFMERGARRLHLPECHCPEVGRSLSRLFEIRSYGMGPGFRPQGLDPRPGDGVVAYAPLGLTRAAILPDLASLRTLGAHPLLDLAHDLHGEAGWSAMGWPTVVSHRKMLPVPLGARILSDPAPQGAARPLSLEPESFGVESLAKLAGGSQGAYGEFKYFEARLESTWSAAPSWAKGLVEALDLARMATARARGFAALDRLLGPHNRFEERFGVEFSRLDPQDAPICYPLWLGLSEESVDHKRSALAERGVFIAKYWPGRADDAVSRDIAATLALPLDPMSPRERIEEMARAVAMELGLPLG